MNLRIPNPNEKQALFLTDEHRHVAYGGARGGGKSWAVRVKSVLLCLKHPGIRVLIVRRTYAELINNHVEPLRAILPPKLATYNKTEKVLRFTNGSTIWFGYCDNDNDLLRYQGAEYDILAIDEATQLKEEWIRKMNMTVRGTNSFPKRTYYTCNPGGVSHHYIKRLFIDRRYQGAERPEDYSFTQALVQDNRALMLAQPEYVAELETLPPKLRAAWLEGKWDIFEGQFFEEFTDAPSHYQDRRYTHVISPFDIPEGWRIYRSFDWGYHRPFSCGWWAVDYDGVIYRILELYGCTKEPNEGVKWTDPEVFTEIRRIEREHPWLKGKKISGVADPAIWNAERGESIAEVAMKHGIYFDRGDHARIPGWMQMHYRMSFDENGYPMMYVFSNCKAFIRTIPLLQYDDHSPEDIDTEGEDHIADETRYFCMSRPIVPRKRAVPDDHEKNPLKLFLDVEREDLTPARRPTGFEIIREDKKTEDRA